MPGQICLKTKYQARTRSLKTYLIVGATSAIAKSVVRRLCAKKSCLILAGRDEAALQAFAKDCVIRGAASAIVLQFDAEDSQSVSRILTSALSQVEKIDVCFIAHGILPIQEKCNDDSAELLRQYQINCLSVVRICNEVASYFEAQGSGCLAVISSVAGDFGKQSNFAYGSAKAMVNIYLEGLRSRLHNRGIRVITVKPGFVDTPMTQEFKKGLMWSQPDEIARHIVTLLNKGDGEFYLPGFWRIIMFVLRNTPPIVRMKLNL
jgi:decaprenylphospho-beta-D-erythro-pentofuranosid-2-ulose 2-reductase